jgi:hypothetical protein
MGNTTLIGLHSEWVGRSQMRCRLRRLNGTHPKLLIDVTELSPDIETHKTEALNVARKLAILNGAASTDAIELFDFQSDHKAVRLKDQVEVTHRQRSTCWAFGLVV